MTTRTLSLRIISAATLASSIFIGVPLAASAQITTTLAPDASANIQMQNRTAGELRFSAAASSTVLHGAWRDRNGSSSAAGGADASARGANDIDQRIASLNQLSAHIGSMKLVPANDSAAITASIANEIAGLTALKAKIAADTDPATLQTDVGSIAKSYRVYLLVIPQDHITASSDRILAVAAQMQQLSVKFAARISAAGSVASSVTAAKTDFDAKVADSIVQANDAENAIAPLVPDNGDQTVRASNTSALKGAIAELMTAQSDLKAARADASIIVSAVSGKDGSEANASTTVQSGAAVQ